MKTISDILKEFEDDFTGDYSEDFPTRVFNDHDDFLIIRESFKNTLRKACETVLEESRVTKKDERAYCDDCYNCYDFEKAVDEQDEKITKIKQ